MTGHRTTGTAPETVTELDLLALADGQLDRDPARRALVERFLARHPEQASRVEAYRAQNQALRRTSEPWLAEPVPERLLQVVYADRPRRRPAARRIAAMLALVLASGAGGWLAGVQSHRDATTLDAFAEKALIDHDRLRTTGSRAGTGAFQNIAPQTVTTGGPRPHDLAGQEMTRQGMAPVAWLTERIAFEIEAPDLGPYGYQLVEQQRLSLDGGPAVRLGYRSNDGQRANLYLRPRWEEGAAAMQRLRTGDVTVLHWLDGPLAIALTTEQQNPEALAEAVRRAVAKASLAEPAPESMASQDVYLLEPSRTPALRRLDSPAPAEAEPKL